MGVGYIQPNSDDGPNDWQPGTTEYVLIDEPYGSPSIADYIEAIFESGDDNKVSTFGFPNAITVYTVTQIVIHTYGSNVGINNPEIDLNIGGWQGYETCDLAGSYQWKLNTFNGSWTQADLDAVQIRYRANLFGKSNAHYIACVYLEVTYNMMRGLRRISDGKYLHYNGKLVVR